mgnify:CR=1 FL=1
MLSAELHHTIHDILARANTDTADGIDSADILQIGTLFGSLNDVQRHLTRQHQRRLLLQLLTIQHLVPIWDHYLPDDHRLLDTLGAMLSLVMKRLSPEQAQQALDHLWEHIDTYPHHPPAIEHISISLYTTLKVLDMIENPKPAFSDYTPDTHAGVALRYAAQAYVTHQTADKHKQHYHYRQYWRYWLTEILPRAWFALPEDTT